MTKVNFKNVIVLILMLGAILGIVADGINLMKGASYTWIGLITGLLNLVILGLCVDYLRG